MHHARRYDAKMDSGAPEEIRLLQDAGYVEPWITETMAADVDAGWTRAEIAEHVRDENSTFTWLLEPMIERAGLEIVDAVYGESAMEAAYVCRKP